MKRVRIVFDNGSQRSYIKEQLKSDLDLIVRGKQSMSIMTFGSRDMSIQECDLVRVGAELVGGEMRVLSLYAVPVICEPFNCQPVTLSNELPTPCWTATSGPFGWAGAIGCKYCDW